MVLRILLVALFFALVQFPVHGDIFRRSGDLIPGTEGIEPGPGAQLDRLNLKSADLYGVDLTDANFEQSDLTGAWVGEANLNRANLTDTVIVGADLWGVSGLTQQQLYSTASYQNRDLRGIQLWSNDLSGWDFSGQDLERAVFSNPRRPSLTADLTNSDLAMTNLTNASLNGATLIGTKLSDAIVTGADFSNTVVRGLSTEQFYSTASYKAKDLRGVRLSENDLSGWDLSGQDLTGASLANANLTGTNFENAKLNGVDLRGVIGFVPPDSAETRSVRLNVGVEGLDVRAGEHLSFPHGGRVFVNGEFTVEDGGIVELIVACGLGCGSAVIELPEGIPITLGGTLRLANTDGYFTLGSRAGASPTLIKWPHPLEAGNVFEAIELPVGEWDVSQFYKTGIVRLNAAYQHDGDFNVNSQLDSNDIDRLSVAIRGGQDFSYDLHLDHLLNEDDRTFWLHEIKGTWFGDANLDGEFNSGDLVDVFKAGEYEDEIALNSGWATGDWNGDGEFDTGDLVAAFKDGGFEAGQRTAVAAVPEPSSIVLLGLSLLGTFRLRNLH